MKIFQIVRIGMGLILCVMTIFSFRRIGRKEAKLKTEGLDTGCKIAFADPLAMFSVILAMMFTTLIIPWGASRSRVMAVNIALLFLTISIYYAALLLLLPLLRRIISARACAVMWIAPTMLYTTIHISDAFGRPIFIITLPLKLLNSLIWIWICGVACVVLWQVLSHFGIAAFSRRTPQRSRMRAS